MDAIKKFDLIKRKNYQTNQAYENAIMKLSSSIKLISKLEDDGKLSSLNIQFNTQDKEVWEEILIFIEYSTNKEIQKYLNSTFDRLISNQKRLRMYKIEDINILISSAKNNGKDKARYIRQLEILKNDISQNRNIVRLQDEFTSTPIVNSKNFYAARLMVKSTEYKSLNSKKNYRMIPLLFLAGLIGAIIGIFYVLILNSMKNRS